MPFKQGGASDVCWNSCLLAVCLLASVGCGGEGEVSSDAIAQPQNAAQTHGLTARYYEGQNFDALFATQVDPQVAFNWGTGAPLPGMTVDGFSVRWTGTLTPPSSGTYTFTTRSDDGIRLWVDGQQLVDHWTRHTASDDSGAIALVAGRPYSIRIDYEEMAGKAVAKLFWTPPGASRRLVPASALLPEPSAPTEDLVLPLDDAPPPGGAFSTFVNTGSGNLDVSVVTQAPGALTSEVGEDGARAVRFPAFDASVSGPRAAIVVTHAGAVDALNPGTRPFRFGVDLRLDADSESGAAGSADNGNNLIQRGLFGDASQYKLQIEHGEISCRIAGSAGAVLVASSVRVKPGVWYRVQCARDANAVTLEVTTWAADGTPTVTRDTKPGTGGDLTPTATREPLSIGCKVSAAGVITRKASDQFNGLLRNAVLAIGAASGDAVR